MKGKELQNEIQQRVLKAGRKKIWQRAIHIARTYGRKSVSQGSWHTTVTHDFEMRLGKTFVSIRVSNYAMGDDYLHITADGTRVFDADLTFESGLKPENRMMAVLLAKNDIRRPMALIKTYIPGCWEKALNLQTIKKFAADRKKEKEAEEERRRLAELNRELTNDEKELAKKFGINTR